MGVGGATAGLLAGVIVAVGSYAALTMVTTALVLGLVLVLVQTPPAATVSVAGYARAD